jgi:hypothetical protein
MKRSLVVLVILLAASASQLWRTAASPAHKAILNAFAFQGSRCFDVDPGIGNPKRDDHYRWAQQQDSTKLMNNLAWKIGILFNCSSVNDDQLAKGFGEMSGIIGDYVSNPACFNNEPNVTGRDRGAHERWARTKTREQVRDNLQWKAVSALRCLNRDNQVAFFADESEVLAKIPSNNDGGGNSSGGGAGGNCQGTMGYAVTVTPNAVRPEGTFSVNVTVPGGNPPERSWVGLFKDDQSLNKYGYLEDIKPAFTRNFTAPKESGQFEVRVLLDSGYSNVAVRCNFTVQ